MKRLLRNRNFCIYFAGRTVSVVGDSFYAVVLILAVLQSTHSVTSGALVLIAGTLPVVLLTLVGGAAGDRWPRSRVMFASDLVRSATQFVMAALLVRSGSPLWALMATQFCYGLGEAFFDPASTGIVPAIVATDDLPLANSLLALSSNAALVGGPALAGIVIALAGAPLAVVLDAVSFLVSAISLYFLSVPSDGLGLAGASMLTQLRAGFAELRKHRWLAVTACYLAVLAFAFNGTIFVLGPATALARLGGPSAWSLMLSAFGAGLISGSFLTTRLLKTNRALGIAYLGNFALVPLLILLGSSDSEWLVVGSSGVAGVAVAVFGVTYTTLLQRSIPPETISRVASYFWLARAASTPIALALAGPASARFGTSMVFAVAALTIGVATLVSAGFGDVWSIGAAAVDARPLA